MRSREDGFRDGNDSFSSENESADRLAEKSADWHAEKTEAGVLGLTRRRPGGECRKYGLSGDNREPGRAGTANRCLALLICRAVLCVFGFQ